jgi:hypothetical protein
MLNRLPTIAALYAIHGVTWTAIQVLNGAHRSLVALVPDRHWSPADGHYPTAERPCSACNGSGVCRHFGDDWCGACGGPGHEWITPAELAKELRRE